MPVRSRFRLLLALLSTVVPTLNCAVAEPPPPLFAYRSFWPEFDAMRQFKDAGVNTVCVFPANTNNSLGQPYSKYPPVWRWFGSYDFGSLNKQFDDVLAVNPEARFICMIDLNSPSWLQRQLSIGGGSGESESFSMLSGACANPHWRKAMTDYLTAFLKHMEARYGERIVAYLLASGQTDEWMDYSRGLAGRAKTAAWRRWLAQHKKPNAPIPAFERLDRATFDNFIRDPAREQDVIDYAQFTGDLIADTILDFARQTRSLVPKQRQIGVFFGYILELEQTRLVWSGHLEYERVFRSPDVDFFISPGTYRDRPMGGGSGFMMPHGTLALSGKRNLHEIDHRTSTYNNHLDEYVSIGLHAQWRNQAETNAGLKREFALATINGSSLWCFDMWGGVFKTPETMKLIAQSKKIWDRFAAQPLKPGAEVALVVDPDSTRFVNDRHAAVEAMYLGTRKMLNRLGAPFEVFLFNDLSHAALDQYRLLIFPGLFVVTPEKRELLDKHVFGKGRSVLFVHAAGICDGKTLDTARVEALTGTPFKTPGVSVADRGSWRSIYVASYDALTPQVLRDAARAAGATIVCDDDVPVFANERLVAIHVAAGGEKTITLPTDSREVRELFTGQVYPVQDRQFKYQFKTPDTALFEFLP